MTELDPLIEDIQWLFDDPISVEALVGDYLASYAEFSESAASVEDDRLVDTVADLIIMDYEDSSLFATLTTEHRESVIVTLRQIFQLIAAQLADNEVNLNDVPAWQLVGLRGTNHVVLAQARTGLSKIDIQNVVDDIREEKHVR